MQKSWFLLQTEITKFTLLQMHTQVLFKKKINKKKSWPLKYDPYHSAAAIAHSKVSGCLAEPLL